MTVKTPSHFHDAPLDLSIIIVNWNTREFLGGCLNSIFLHINNLRAEVILIDNASIDGSVEFVCAEFPQVKIVINKNNRGFAAASNQGIELASGRYLLLLNTDTVLIDDCLSRIVEFGDTNPMAGAIGCRVLNPDLTVQHSCLMYPGLINLILRASFLSKLFPRSTFFGREAMTWWNYDSIREVEFIKGCFLMVRRETVRSIGLLDERFFVYAEEADWCYRMKQEGWQILFTPSGEVVHKGAGSTDKAGLAMIWQLWGSVLTFIRKHHTIAYYFACCGVISIFFAVRVLPCVGLAILRHNERSIFLTRATAYAIGSFYVLIRGAGGLNKLSSTYRGMSAARF